MNFYVGTAGWSIPKAQAARFLHGATHLERYAQQLTAVEINSSFYHSHKPDTYARWATSVPEGFRFAVKMPRTISHQRKLADTSDLLHSFLGEIKELGKKLGPVLIQLPPSLRYDEKIALGFFEAFRARFSGSLACEPRHPTWFTEPVDARLKEFHIARVAADPPVVPRARQLGGYLELLYLRLHGAPKMYYSPYSPAQIDEVAELMRGAAGRASTCWCVFDNTALGEATKDALSLLARLSPSGENVRGISQLRPDGA